MRKSVRDYFGEGLLIVFSILLALAANEWRQRANQTASLNAAVIDLSAEIADNLEILSGVADYQRDVALHLNEAAEGEFTGKTAVEIMMPIFSEVLKKHGRFSALGTRGPIQRVSWLTAKDRGAVAQLDYDTAKQLATVYESLGPAVDDNYLHIANQFNSPQMYVERDQKATLLRTASNFSESASRTENLEHFLELAQAALKEDYPGLADPSLDAEEE